MSDQDPENPEQEAENTLTSERFEEFSEALDMLYIPANLGGRLQFMQAWPAAAERIFGAELIAFDTDGTDDRDRRDVLEQEACDRHAVLIETLETLEEKSADKGVLQVEYVEGLIKDLGRDLALLLYAPKFVDRVFPPPPPAEGESQAQESEEGAVKPAEADTSSPASTPSEQAGIKEGRPAVPEVYEDIQPISVEPPVEPSSESSSPVPPQPNAIPPSQEAPLQAPMPSPAEQSPLPQSSPEPTAQPPHQSPPPLPETPAEAVAPSSAQPPPQENSPQSEGDAESFEKPVRFEDLKNSIRKDD